MKDLDKNYIYDLSDLNKEERTELYEYLLSVDITYKNGRNEFKKLDKDFICYDFCNNVWDWEVLGDESERSKIAMKNRIIINAKTLFTPKVNIINPTESSVDKILREWKEHFINQNGLSQVILNKKPKYKFQHVEVNKINDSIDLVFFKEKKNGLIKVKRITYFYSSNDGITDEYLVDVKVSVIKFLEQCEK